MPKIERSVEIRAPIERVFAFVADVRNHARVVPPETEEELLDPGDTPMRVGTVVRLRAKYGGIRWTLASQILAFEPPQTSHPGIGHFRDEQVRGPFALWQHDHWFSTTPTGSTILTDRVVYEVPSGPLGKLLDRTWLNSRLSHLIEFMHAEAKRLIETEARNKP